MDLTAIKDYVRVADVYDLVLLGVLETVFEQEGYHSIFINPDAGRLAWGNDPGEPKWPLSTDSRRIILTNTNWVIVRGPSTYRTYDGRIFGWAMAGSSSVHTIQDFWSFLHDPHVGAWRSVAKETAHV